jgi:hypothetical protein
MANETKEFSEKFKRNVAKMKQQVPETVGCFAGMMGGRTVYTHILMVMETLGLLQGGRK